MYRRYRSFPTNRVCRFGFCSLLALAPLSIHSQTPAQNDGSGLKGYISMNVPSPPAGYGHGVSLYAAAWPLLTQPLASFQVGLASTWILPDNTGFPGDVLCPAGTLAKDQNWDQQRGGSFADVFQTIEGGLGFWGSTQFGSAIPKYRMNGTPDCYSHEISSPGWGFGDPQALPDNKMGLAQLSNRIIVPPDGLTFSANTSGQVMGVAWMALPMTDIRGYYHLKTSFNEALDLCLEGNVVAAGSSMGGASFMAPCGDFSGEMWKLVPAGSGYYYLQSNQLESQNKCLEGNKVAAGSTLNGASFMAPCGDFSGELWKLVPSNPGYFHLQTAFLESQNMCLEGNRPGLFSYLQGAAYMAPCGDFTGQDWELEGQTVSNVLPKGDKSWTLFLNTANFKGPVAFYIPDAWTDIDSGYPVDDGRGLDTRPGRAGSGAMEFNTVPYFESQDATQVTYSKVPRIQFPVDAQGNTTLMQDLTVYSSGALFDAVKSWFNGNLVTAVGSEAPSGVFDNTAGWTPNSCTTNPVTFRQGPDNSDFALSGFDTVVQTKILDAPTCTFGLSWAAAAVKDNLAALPEYYRQDGQIRTAVTAADVPASTRLTDAAFRPASKGSAYTSPGSGDNAWTSPGAASGPYTATLSDGSTVTYAWYRFVDQPALQHLGLTAAEKQALQERVELIHWNWPIDRDYMPAPSRGSLATLEGALIVTPPNGLEVGFVPIVIRQQ